MRTPPQSPDELDALAHAVATALDHDEDAYAWQLTRALAVAAGIADVSEQPPGPVIGRRFAQAHRRLAALAAGAPAPAAGAAPPAAGATLPAAGAPTPAAAYERAAA